MLNRCAFTRKHMHAYSSSRIGANDIVTYTLKSVAVRQLLGQAAAGQ